MCDRFCRVCDTLLNDDNWHASAKRNGNYLCKECSAKQNKEYRQKSGYKASPEKLARDRYAGFQRHLTLKQTVIDAYGGKCECCGETDLIFLSIDHINRDGSEHRKELKKLGMKLYEWLVENDYPSGFRTLCLNCNCALGFYGYCPHNHIRVLPEKKALRRGRAASPLDDADCCRVCDISLGEDNAQYSAKPSEIRDGITRQQYICKACYKIKMSEFAYRRKMEVMAEYGGKCVECGETHLEFLTIDHINNDGAERRKELGINGGSALYSWLKKNGYPKDNYQILCFNCNVAKGILHRRPKPYTQETP